MSAAKPTFRQIVDEYTDKIKSGELPPGSRLPSTSRLAEIHGVSTGTVKRVLSLLQDRGLINGQPGRGTFVADRPTGWDSRLDLGSPPTRDQR